MADGTNDSEDPEARLARLAERQLSFDALLENMSEGFALCEAIWNKAGKLSDYTILELNSALQRLLGVGPEAIGMKLSDRAGDRSEWLALCEKVLKTGEPTSFEVYTRRIDRWHEIRVTRVTENRMAQLFFDVTERKHAEARQASLFDELNHRVSNNLTLVSGILQMKANESDDPAVREQLLSAESRVHSIAHVHRALYRGARNDVVAFASYLQELCAAVRESLIDDDRILVTVETDRIAVPIDTAIPLGMIVSELLTNAIKYAYPGQTTGVVIVRFAQEGSAWCLSVADAGPGLPAEAQPPSRGLGMRLIKSLAEQLQAKVSTLGPPGTTFMITLDGMTRASSRVSAQEGSPEASGATRRNSLKHQKRAGGDEGEAQPLHG